MYHWVLGNISIPLLYTDFSKAFDKVNLSILMHKLDLLGFQPRFLKWVASYRYNRTQRMIFEDTLSDTINVSSGVPQGSHLGPILFLLLINDISSVIEFSKILLYVDDVNNNSNLTITLLPPNRREGRNPHTCGISRVRKGKRVF